MLGPSGSGKTTTLRVIAGFERPDAGRVELQGVDVTRVAPAQRAVNTVFQDYALFPHMTVAENIEYGLRVKGMARRDRRARADGDAREGAAAGSRRPEAGAAVGRPAAARRARARDRQRAAGPPSRRAARRARPQAAPGDADLPQGIAARPGHHVRLRHARPGRGADDERPARRLQRRDRSNRSARRPRSTSIRRRSSSPASSACPTCWSATAGASRSGRRRFGWSTRPEARASRERAGGRLRRHGHALRRRPRCGRRARRRPAEPRDVLAGGARGTREAGPPLVAAGAHVRDQKEGT